MKVKKPSPELMQMIREQRWLKEMLSRAKEAQGRPPQVSNGLEQALKERAALKEKHLH